MTKTGKITLLIIAALAISLTITGEANATGKKAPEFTLKTTDGKSLTLSRLKGKRGVVLVFFATWCPSCMNEVSEVKKFVGKSKGKKVLTYGINIEQPARIVDKFIRDYGVNYRILLDPESKVAADYKVRGIPLVVGIDGNGIIRYREHGLPKDTESLIKTLTAGTE